MRGLRRSSVEEAWGSELRQGLELGPRYGSLRCPVRLDKLLELEELPTTGWLVAWCKCNLVGHSQSEECLYRQYLGVTVPEGLGWWPVIPLWSGLQPERLV